MRSMRCSTEPMPFGIARKSSSPSSFWPFMQNGQWSVETIWMSLVRSACHMWCWWPSSRAAQRRRAHPLRALELAPLLAERAELLLERQVEVLRARLAEHVPALVARPRELLDGLLRAHVHDVQRRTGEVREHDRAVRRLLLHLPGARDAVVVRRLLARLGQLRREHVDRGAVLGVHHREQPGLARDLHRLQDLRVVGVEDPG